MGKLSSSIVVLNSMRRIKDYEMIALTSKRAGKIKDEGRAYYCMGVLSDNMQKPRKAISYFRKFLKVCRQIKDVHGTHLNPLPSLFLCF